MKHDKKPAAGSSRDRGDAFLERMRKRFTLAQEALVDVHREAEIDWAYRIGDQWDPQVKASRERDGRPVFSINRLPQFVRQITGEQKRQRPAIQISPVGDGADIETAEIIQGLTRHIEQASDASEAYDLAFEHMVTGGFGFIRLITDYCDYETDNQDICFQREVNPFAHYPDPRCKSRDYSDARYWFVVDTMTKEDFEEEYPDSEVANARDFTAYADNAPDWITRDSVRVAEYFWIEESKTTNANGRVYKTKTVHWCKTNGVEILEETVIPGEWIPIVPILGEELIVKGRRHLISAIRYARTPQQLYNLWQSAMAESIAIAPKAPFLATPAQIEGYEDLWEQANTQNLPYLPYNPDKNAPPPVRQFGEPPIAAIQNALAHADNDLKATTGLYDASLGAPGPEQSGKAILLRKQQGDSANFGFVDSMQTAIKHLGRIIIGWVPHYYDAPRVLRIVNPDRSSKIIQINQPFQNDQGLMQVYNLTVGTYDVSVSTGPSFETARAEAAASIMQLVQAEPALLNVVGDLLVQNFDWPLAPEIAARLKKLLPAQLQDNANGLPAQAQAAFGQLQQQNAMLAAQIKQLMAEREAEVLKLQSNEKIAAWKTQAELVTALAKINSADATARADREYSRLEQMFDMAHDAGLAAQQNAHTLQQNQQAAALQAVQSHIQAQQQQAQQSQAAPVPRAA